MTAKSDKRIVNLFKLALIDEKSNNFHVVFDTANSNKTIAHSA